MTTRRDLLALSAMVAGVGAAALGGETAAAAGAATAKGDLSATGARRRAIAYRARTACATRYMLEPVAEAPLNGDEARHPNFIGQFHKTLPHDAHGIVAADAYRQLAAACRSGLQADFDRVPAGGDLPLRNPLGGIGFGIEGLDSHHCPVEAASGIDSPKHGADMAEVYWLALTRDIPFTDYGQHPDIAAAASDLSALPGYGWVTPATIFRGRLPGEAIGPYISQFLWLDVPYGALPMRQRYRVPVPGNRWMTNYGEWLAIQNGARTGGSVAFDAELRWLRNGADLAEWLRIDFSYQGFLNAALILLSFGPQALNPGHPYRNSPRQEGFTSFGGPAVLDMVARVARDALAATWCQKWRNHRKIRPEAYGGVIENTLNRGVDQHANGTLLSSAALGRVFSRQGNYLLPMAYPEGCPTHPAYPGGHSTMAGACATVLKAFFDENFEIPAPVVASRDGLSLLSWSGAPLTVGAEVHKLAGNIGLGRDTAGVHYRQDIEQGLIVGEAVALSVLKDFRTLYAESFDGLRFQRFDGSLIVI